MFDVYCPEHESRMLLFANDVEEIRNTEEGIEVHYRCTCGYRGVWLTGRKKDAPGTTRGDRDRAQDTHSRYIA